MVLQWGMIVTCVQMREAEDLAFGKGRSAALLMDVAGSGVGQALESFFPVPGSLVVYLGKGNNGGDGLVAARHLADLGWEVLVRLTSPVGELAELPARHFEDLESRGLAEVLDDDEDLSFLPKPLVLLDGLLGIGAKGAIRGEPAAAAAEMNAARERLGAATVAIDIPSGIDGDTGEPYPGAVVADITMTVSAVKCGLLGDDATGHVGRLVLVPVPEIPVDEVGDGGRVLITPERFVGVLGRRRFETHKGRSGRVAVVAGSKSFPGAGVLASMAAVRGGAGLVTLYVKEEAHGLIAAKAVPEVMVTAVEDYREVLEAEADVVALGPGLGKGHAGELMDVIFNDGRPMVVDADGLNVLAEAGVEKISGAKGERLLTPHPGEMARLLGLDGVADLARRAEVVGGFVGKFPGVTLLLKGARTVVGGAGKPFAFNSTGHPGMATGGVGDVLTGLCAALMVQGLGCYEAGCVGSWINGRAAERAVWGGLQSEESLAATDLVGEFGRAFSDWREEA